MDDELIKYNTGHALDPYHPYDDYEYAAEEYDDVDADHQPVKNVRII